jgi:zinc transporter 2
MTAILVYEAILRFMNPGGHTIGAGIMFITACLGLSFNIVILLTLDSDSCGGKHGHSHGGGGGHGHSHGDHGHGHSHGGHDEDEEVDAEDVEEANEEFESQAKGEKKKKKKRNVNEEAAFIHVLGDLISSAGVILIAALIYLFPHLWWLDPTCTIFFAIIVLFTTVGMVKDIYRILMQGTAEDVNVSGLENDLDNIPNCINVHDIHVWSVSQGKNILSMHAMCKKEHHDEVLKQIDTIARSKKYDLNHITV